MWSLLCSVVLLFDEQHAFQEIGAVNYQVDSKQGVFKKVSTFDEVVSDYLGDLTMYSVLSALSKEDSSRYGDYSFLDPKKWIADSQMSMRPYDKAKDESVMVNKKEEHVSSRSNLFTYQRPLFDTEKDTWKYTAQFDPPYQLRKFALSEIHVRQLAAIHLVDMALTNTDRFPWPTITKASNYGNIMFHHDKGSVSILPIDQGFGFILVSITLTNPERASLLRKGKKKHLTNPTRKLADTILNTRRDLDNYVESLYDALEDFRGGFANSGSVSRSHFVETFIEVLLNQGARILRMIRRISGQHDWLMHSCSSCEPSLSNLKTNVIVDARKDVLDNTVLLQQKLEKLNEDPTTERLERLLSKFTKLKNTMH